MDVLRKVLQLLGKQLYKNSIAEVQVIGFLMKIYSSSKKAPMHFPCHGEA